MRESIKSLMSFSWAMALFGVRQFQNLLAPRPDRFGGGATGAFRAVARAMEGQLTGPTRDMFQAGERLQQGMIDRMFGAVGSPRVAPMAAGRADLAPVPLLPPRPSPIVPPPPQPLATPLPDVVVTPAGLETLTHLVIGEGLAAGIGDFALSAETQRFSFANLLTQRMGVPFSQPLIQPPGLANVPGFPALPVLVPALMQTTVLEELPPVAPFSNLSVPGLTVEDVLTLRPRLPLIHRDDAKQTALNLLVGLSDLLRGDDPPPPTPLEAALRQSPACVILELGFYEVLEPAVTGRLDRLPDVDAFCSGYTRILEPLRRAGVAVLVLTVPDPTDTAYFSSLKAAARFLKVQAAVLDRAYHLPDDSCVTVNGLLEIAHQMLNSDFQLLSPGAVLSGEASRAITDCVQRMNAALTNLARAQGAMVYDLHDLFRRVRDEGIAVGPRRLGGEYFGGFYSLNGYYPGPTGQAILADELVPLVNEVYRASFGPIDVGAVFDADPVAHYQAAQGHDLSWEEVTRPTRTPAVPRRPPPLAVAAPSPQDGGTPGALRLPPGLEQVLPLNKGLSYHGDGIRVAHCADDREAEYGGCADLPFGGLALFGSHLSGLLHICFSPPTSQVTHFTVDWGDGLDADDGILSAPRFFRLPALRARVIHWPGTVVSGDLNLDTGEVSNLDFQVRYLNSALEILPKGDPNFPVAPIQFPGAYGSAWARFDPRPDGKLDFTFQGRTFIPLGKELKGDPFRWPLAFGAMSDRPASIPAAGTALHPHLHLSTCETVPGTDEEACPDIPFNTVQELTLFTHNSNFGDKFSLTGEAWGGPAQGRSHVLGRVQLQFGERFGDTVPVAVSALPPGGMLLRPDDTPLVEQFPSRLPGALMGHDEFLRFPLRTYFLDAVGLVEDPFDLAVGAVDLRTGRILGEMLHRGFIDQNVFFALVRVEPRTPRSSFLFQGPACLEPGAEGQMIYRFNGVVHIPYPEGFKFPAPDLATGYVAGPNSALDPFFRLQAMAAGRPPAAGKEGAAERVTASTGALFSYRYFIPGDPTRRKALFEYVNHTQDGTFRMSALAWCAFTHSRESKLNSRDPDTVTFAGFGSWSKSAPDRLHVATVQVSTSRRFPYVSIQIDGGLVSNVNTKPADDAATLP
jgi:hypothetical protein